MLNAVFMAEAEIARQVRKKLRISHRSNMVLSNFGNAGKPDLPPQRLLRRKDAARYVQQTWGIPLSPQTMAKLAVVGGGPLFRKAGRFPLYEIVDLDTWARLKLGPKRRSTSDRCDQ